MNSGIANLLLSSEVKETKGQWVPHGGSPFPDNDPASHKCSRPYFERLNSRKALPRLLNAGYEASAIQDVVTKAGGKEQVFLAQGFDAN